MTADQLTRVAAVAKMHGGTITADQLSVILGTPIDRVPFSASELRALCDTPTETFIAQSQRERASVSAVDRHGPNPNYRGLR